MKKKASDCECVECGRKAVAFWPVADPDITAQPYCRKCLDEAKEKMLIEFCDRSYKNWLNRKNQ